MMDEKLEIRPAQAQDAPAIQACAQDAYQQYVAAIGKKPAPMVADFKALISAGVVYAAIDKTDLLGFIVFHHKEKHFLLENVAVRSDAAGQGVGKRLIAFCESEARRAGVRSVKLYTNEVMAQNLSIYAHLGYREVSRRKEAGFNRVFFEKIL